MGLRAFLLLWVIAACSGDDGPDESRQGGDTTIEDRSDMAFTHPAANLTSAQQSQFMLGTSPFDFRWEIPQLGPTYNNDRCFGCHGSFGRGQAQIGADGFTDINGPQSEALVRVSLPAGEGQPEVPGGVVPVPGYGDQIQDHATVGLAEAAVTLTWTEQMVMFDDGDTISLRTPHLDIRDLNGDPIPGDMHTSFRIAPPIVGLGLLEAMDLTPDPDDTDGDGISGTTNMVWNAETQQMELGRFGWKSNTPTLHVQAAAAAANDMGLSSYIFPDPSGNNDVQDDQMEGMAFMVAAVGVPAAAPRDATATHGRQVFEDLGCTGCHLPTVVTGKTGPEQFQNQTIHPWTDMLLHDMGDLLTDARQDYQAQGVEWRTPALWGIGIAQTVRDNITFLHDGRARTFEEAIMWHGGEAQAAHDKYQAASKADRDALSAFLGTL